MSVSYFPCNSCGLCCRIVGKNPAGAFLNRGDGICRYLNLENNQCTIYENRPMICRVKEFYLSNLQQQISWTKFIDENVKICHQLQKEAGLELTPHLFSDN